MSDAKAEGLQCALRQNIDEFWRGLNLFSLRKQVRSAKYQISLYVRTGRGAKETKGNITGEEEEEEKVAEQGIGAGVGQETKLIVS